MKATGVLLTKVDGVVVQIPVPAWVGFFRQPYLGVTLHRAMLLVTLGAGLAGGAWTRGYFLALFFVLLGSAYAAAAALGWWYSQHRIVRPWIEGHTEQIAGLRAAQDRADDPITTLVNDGASPFRHFGIDTVVGAFIVVRKNPTIGVPEDERWITEVHLNEPTDRADLLPSARLATLLIEIGEHLRDHPEHPHIMH